MKLRHHIEALAVQGVTAALRPMSMDGVRRAGARLGRLAHRLDAKHRNVALDNLARAFPSRSAAEREALTLQVFEHFGSLLLELLKFGTLTRDEMVALCDVEGEDRLRQAYRHGRGVLIFTGHFGNWEMHGLVQGIRVEPLSVLARPLDNPLLHDALERIRTRTGNSVIYRQGALRKVFRELAQNHAVAMLIDQHLLTDTVQVDFFGRTAATTSALAALALRTGAPVVPVFALPIDEGRYRLIYEHPVAPPDSDSPDAIREFTQRCTDVLEMYVRRYPERWLWMHRRWREQPASAAGGATAERTAPSPAGVSGAGDSGA
jgi:KDO2-lipid IV(A) lauroyltransferase